MNKRVLFLLLATVALALLSVSAIAAQDQVELVFWSMWNEPEGQAQAIQEWITSFEAEHPNIKFSVVWNGRQNQTLVRTALTAGTKIDLMDQDHDQVAGGLVLEGMGYPLNDLLEETALDEDVPIKEVFLPGTLDLLQGETKYLWPYIYNTVQFFYDKRVFAEVGKEPPETWDEFLALNDALKDAGYAPIATESDVPGYQIMFYSYLVARMEGAGKIQAASADKTGEMWNEPVFLKAAQMVRELWDRGDIPPETEGYVWPQGQQTLAAGISAMEICGSWLPIELASAVDPEFEWGGFTFPMVEGGKGSENALQVALLSFMIMKDSEYKQEAGEFLKFIMTKENQQLMADKSLVGVTRKDVTWAEPIADAAKAAAEADILFGDSDGVTALYAEYLNNVLYPNYRDMFLGQITPEEFVDNMATQTKDYWANK